MDTKAQHNIDSQNTENLNYGSHSKITMPNENYYKMNPQQDRLGRKLESRRVNRCILYSILTLGLYFLFWHYEISNESNAFIKSKNLPRPSVCVVLTVITFGLFLIYWTYRVSQQHKTWLTKNKYNARSFTIYYVFAAISVCLSLLGNILNLICLSIGPSDVGQTLLLVFSLVSILASYIFIFVAFAKMQTQINYMIAQVKQKLQKNIYIADHNIFNRPYLSSVLVVLFVDVAISGALLIYQEILFLILQGPLMSLGIVDNNIWQELLDQTASLIANCDKPYPLSIFLLQTVVSLGILLWFKLRFWKFNYKGVLGLKNILKGLLYVLPAFGFLVINFLFANAANIKIGLIVLAIAPAFAEEITFRGIIVPNILRTANRKYAIYAALFISSALFGVAHLMNYFSGASLSITIYQIIYTFFIGLIIAAAFIRTGNLWPGIIFHFCLDFLAFISDRTIQEGLVQTADFEFSLAVIPIAVIALLCLFFALWLCRPSKHTQIYEVWDNKWGCAAINKSSII